MSKAETIQAIRASIAKNRFAEALAQLDVLLTHPVQRNEWSVLQRQYEEIRRLERLRTEAPEVIDRKKNRLHTDILELLDDIELGTGSGNTSNRDRELLERILEKLDSTFTIYKAQNNKRNYLMRKLRERFEIPRVENYYQVFADYHGEMNAREIYQHKVIRGFTRDIKANHQDTLDILSENSHLKKIIPILDDLEAHLRIWLSKYNSLFEDDETMTLIYTGVEEQVKFPPKIRQTLQDYLDR